MIFALLAIALFACKNDSSNQIRTQAAQNVIQAQADLDASTAPSKELIMAIQEKTANKGENVCLSVSAEGFSGLFSMQYSIRWDPKVLRFQKVDKFNLPWLTVDNFGLHLTDEGLITSVWIDNELKGISVKEGDEIYQLCFEIIGESGQESEVSIAKDPTPIEVVTSEEKVIPMKTMPGKVSIR